MERVPHELPEPLWRLLDVAVRPEKPLTECHVIAGGHAGAERDAEVSGDAFEPAVALEGLVVVGPDDATQLVRVGREAGFFELPRQLVRGFRGLLPSYVRSMKI